MRLIHRLAAPACAIVAATCTPDADPPQPVGAITLASDYEPLVTGFAWAKARSLAYVFDDDPVGKWYEAALPGREAFCMRDVSHQAYGALALGLGEHTKNMMGKFAASIAASRDWCAYWEIDRHDRPAPVDYRSDEDFWYNLPASFDVLWSLHRIYEWTGDPDYVEDAVFLDYYERTMDEYVRAWDADGDGLLESAPENGYRGIPSYWEGRGPRALTAGDLVASQYAANLAYAALLTVRDEALRAAAARAEGQRLRGLYNRDWWLPDLGRFATAILPEGRLDTTHIPLLQILPLYFGIVEPGDHREQLVANLAEGEIVEVNVYLSEVYFRNGRSEEAFRYLMRQMDPALERREYPENPFTAVGTTVRFLVGLDPRWSDSLVETTPRLPAEVAWVQVEHVPAHRNALGVRHDGLTQTRFTNEHGPTVRWRAVLPGRWDSLAVDGVLRPASVRHTEWGEAESYVEVDVDPRETVVVAAPS